MRTITIFILMDNINWTKATYNLFLNQLESYSDSKYKNFHSTLIKDSNKLIGVRTPVLKSIAKDISKTNYKKWLKYNKHTTYEETIIHGLILTYLNIDFKNFLEALDNFIPLIDNWAICDIVCANAKIFKKNLEEGLIYITNYLNNSNPWIKRVGLVLLLDYYINDKYIDKVLSIANNIKSNEYYVKMANAWLISICYIKYPIKTEAFLNNTKIDNWTYNKVISKICDSKRITINTKNKLKDKLKR